MAARARWGRLDKGRAVRSSPVRIALTLLVILALGVAGGASTWAAFSNTTLNSANGFTAGSVDLDDNDGGAAMLSIVNGTPGSTDTSCIRVTYNGSLPSSVRLYGATSGSGLDPYLNLVVTRGSVPSGAFDSCATFTADATNYVGAGNGVIFNGTLQGYADSYAAGLVDPTTGTPETWTNGEIHAYRFTVTMQNNAAAAGKNATQAFSWEARNI